MTILLASLLLTILSIFIVIRLLCLIEPIHLLFGISKTQHECKELLEGFTYNAEQLEGIHMREILNSIPGAIEKDT